MKTLLRASVAGLVLVGLTFVHLLPVSLLAPSLAFAAPTQNMVGGNWVSEAQPATSTTTPFTTSANPNTQTSTAFPARVRRFKVYVKPDQNGAMLLISFTGSTYTGSGLGSLTHFIPVTAAVPYISGEYELLNARTLFTSATIASVSGILVIDTLPNSVR